MSQSFNPVSITLADGVVRHLEYSLGDVRRIKAKYVTKPTDTPAGATNEEQLAASAFGQIFAYPAEEIMPELIFAGLVEKEGLTQQMLEDKLLLAPMIEYAQVKFTEAFFGDRQKRWLEAVHGSKEASVKNLEVALEKMDAAIEKSKESPAATVTAAATSTLQ